MNGLFVPLFDEVFDRKKKTCIKGLAMFSARCPLGAFFRIFSHPLFLQKIFEPVKVFWIFQDPYFGLLSDYQYSITIAPFLILHFSYLNKIQFSDPSKFK